MNIRIIMVFTALIAFVSVSAFAGTTITADTPAVESAVAVGASKIDLFFTILP